MKELEILQVAREIAPGGGVSGVAHQLEWSFQQQGLATSRFTLANIGLSGNRARLEQGLLLRKAFLARDVIAFSVIGTARLRSEVGRKPQTVSICHNDCVFGDIYVNHGLHRSMIASSRNPFSMVARNPLHLFLLGRESVRYRLGVHRRIVCFSNQDRDELEKVYPAATGLVQVIPNGVDTDRFRPDPEARERTRAALMIGPEDFALLFVGHEFRRKGLSHAIQALELLTDRVQLVVAGAVPASEAREFQRLSQDTHVAERVHFLGKRDDVPDLMNASDALVLPSRFESWALVGVEALATGTPILMTAVGGIADYLVAGGNGYFILQDARDIAAKVRMLMDDPVHRAKMSEVGRQTSLRYSWASVAEKYVELALEVKGEKAAGA